MCTASNAVRAQREAHYVDSLFDERVPGEGALGKAVPQAAHATPVPGSTAASRRDLPCQLFLTHADLAPRAVLDPLRRVAYIS